MQKDFIARKAHGFEEWTAHILGRTDGIPKTPAWAANECGVREAVITALAKQWARKNTILACGARGGWGGAHRTAFGHEWARLMVYLAAMQGLGKPGNNLWGAQMGSPVDSTFFFPAYADATSNIARAPICDKEWINPVKQKLFRTMVPEAILEGRSKWMGDGFCRQLSQQFNRHEYPLEACSPGPFLELFARGPRPGWVVWGNQSENYYPTWATYSNHSQVRRVNPGVAQESLFDQGFSSGAPN